MKYHIYGYTGKTSEGYSDYERFGEFTPSADLNNCWFGEAQLWTPEKGFKRGAFKVGNHWLVSDDEYKQLDCK